jgi:peptide/nickel transport system permease protein
MSRYIIRRVLGAILVMWAVATLVFFMMRLVPGDPIAAMLFDAGDAETVARLRQKLGLDQSVFVQYVKWLWHALQGDFGSSLYGSNAPVARMIVEAIPRTLSLTALAFVIAVAIAVPAGLIAATRRNSAADHAVTVVAFLGLSMPDF